MATDDDTIIQWLCGSKKSWNGRPPQRVTNELSSFPRSVAQNIFTGKRHQNQAAEHDCWSEAPVCIQCTLPGRANSFRTHSAEYRTDGLYMDR
jgi:hypothetical protein